MLIRILRMFLEVLKMLMRKLLMSSWREFEFHRSRLPRVGFRISLEKFRMSLKDCECHWSILEDRDLKTLTCRPINDV